MEYTQSRLLEKITGFLLRIGIGFSMRKIDCETLMPGIRLHEGIIIIDAENLKYPGDILHEAGHVATMAPEGRKAMNGALATEGDGPQGAEMMAQAWSYAACIEIGIDPHLVFHEAGYHGNGQALVKNFSSGYPVALPMLQWLGMAYDKKNAEKLNTLAYPSMICWVRKA